MCEDVLKKQISKDAENLWCSYIGPHVIFTARIIKKFANKHFKQFNIGFEQASILFVLQAVESIHINQLIEMIGKDKGTISRCVKSLAHRGFISKVEAKHDRRIHVIKLTESGRDLCLRMEKSFDNVNQVPEKILESSKQEQFHKMLNEIINIYITCIKTLDESLDS